VTCRDSRFTIRGRGDDLVTGVIHCLSEHRIRVTDFARYSTSRTSFKLTSPRFATRAFPLHPAHRRRTARLEGNGSARGHRRHRCPEATPRHPVFHRHTGLFLGRWRAAPAERSETRTCLRRPQRYRAAVLFRSAISNAEPRPTVGTSSGTNSAPPGAWIARCDRYEPLRARTDRDRCSSRGDQYACRR
jgi:hypothetical protein